MTDTIDYSLHYGAYHRQDKAYFEQWFEQNRGDLVGLIGSDHDKPILDVGCAFGLLVHALLRLGCRQVHGIDMSAEQIQVAQRHGLPCEHVEEEAQAAYFAARSQQFGVIFLFDVLEHVQTARQIEFLRMLRVALAPGGRLILQTPNASSPIAAHMRYIDYTHTSSFTVDSLQFVLLSAGFVGVMISETHDEMSRSVGLDQPMRLLRKICGNLLRVIWRLLYLSEFGRPGMKLPLSRNLLAIAQAG